MLSLKDIEANQVNQTKEFTDKGNIPKWSKNAIETIVAKGYMGGYPDGKFQPDKSITRAESISVLDRVIGVLYND